MLSLSSPGYSNDLEPNDLSPNILEVSNAPMKLRKAIMLRQRRHATTSLSRQPQHWNAAGPGVHTSRNHHDLNMQNDTRCVATVQDILRMFPSNHTHGCYATSALPTLQENIGCVAMGMPWIGAWPKPGKCEEQRGRANASRKVLTVTWTGFVVTERTICNPDNPLCSDLPNRDFSTTYNYHHNYVIQPRIQDESQRRSDAPTKFRRSFDDTSRTDITLFLSDNRSVRDEVFRAFSEGNGSRCLMVHTSEVCFNLNL